MNRLLLLLSNTLLVLLEVIVLTFFASIFFKKNLSTVKFLISIILLAAFNVTALALLDKYFWLKAFVLTIVDAIWLKISYIDTIIQSIGIAIGFYSFISVWDVLVLLAISFLSKREFSTYMENPVEYYLICYGVKCVELLIVAIVGLLAKKRFQFKNTIWQDWLRVMLFPLTTTFCSVMFFQIYEIESNAGTELLLCEIVLLFFDVMAIWLLDYMDQQQAALQDNIILKRSIKQEKESMEALVDAYSDQRRKTHDFQNQLAIIYGLAQQESPDSQVLNYVRPLLKKEILPTLITKTGRNVVDILLTQKYSVAIKNQILFQMQLGDLSDFPLSDEELIVVLSNLLDNALNACMDISNSKERRILLKMRTKEAAGFLYLENPTAHNVEILDNKIVPSKTTSIEHGYGLKNVTAILDNIGALYVFDYNSVFQDGQVFSGIHALATTINDSTLKVKNCESERFAEQLEYHNFLLLLNELGVKSSRQVYPLSEVIIESAKKKLKNRYSATQSVPYETAPGGMCVPGVYKLFVTVDGKLLTCERTNEPSNAGYLGDLSGGIELDRALKMLNVAKLTERQCQNCWAFRYCTNCISHCDDGKDVNAKLRTMQCQKSRGNVYYTFRIMILLLNKKLLTLYRKENQ